jgi:hypothetical protein
MGHLAGGAGAGGDERAMGVQTEDAMDTKVNDGNGIRLALMLVVMIGAGMAGYQMGKGSADRWYNTEPDVMNCPAGHACQWSEIDTTAYHCMKNCGALEELDTRVPPEAGCMEEIIPTPLPRADETAVRR